jgi:alginate O-acetyltransferase complex protein AlgI
MLFNSLVYLYLFLPIVVIGYLIASRFLSVRVKNVWLVGASLFFYGFWNPLYVPLLIGSIVVNFFLGTVLLKDTVSLRGMEIPRRAIFIVGAVLNLVLLGIFKYTDFFISNINWITGAHIPLAHLVLPLAISFFTFEQITYLVECYKRTTHNHGFLNYAIFVTFFPHLIAGPIIFYKDIMPQLGKVKDFSVYYRNIGLGLFLLSLGLVKKVGIADTFAVWANAGYAFEGTLTFFDAWATSLSYAFQLYFDFSGYTDMAIGSALLFNISLPQNFNSPYKATNIQDFWQRWHMSLTVWFRAYLYFPLAVSLRRFGQYGALASLFVTFVIIGLWHGPAWTFVIFGCLHGGAMLIHHVWKMYAKISLPTPVAWFLTFNFVNISWIFFRAENFGQISSMLKSMFGVNGLGPTSIIFAESEKYVARLGVPDFFEREVFVWILLFLGVVLLLKNSNYYKEHFSPTVAYLSLSIVFFLIGIVNINKFSEFLYFNF